MNRKAKLTSLRRALAGLAVASVFFLAGCGKSPGRPHSATLTWDASTSAVVGYNVYRTSKLNGNVRKLTPQPINATRFVDSTVQPGLTYSYAVTSVNSKGQESRPSTPALATIPDP